MDLKFLKNFSQKSKHDMLRYFRKYQKYCVIIKFLFLQNNHSNLNFNLTFDYEFGTQGFNIEYLAKLCTE